MQKKIVKIAIDSETFPNLFNIKSEILGEKCYDIFMLGYKTMFPNIPNSLRNNHIDNKMDMIRNEFIKLNDKIDNSEMDTKINMFVDLVQELFGINYNSNKKGRLSEDIVYNIITNKFKDYSVEITRKTHHCGDGIISIPSKDNKKIMVEIKNYSSNIDKDELDKLLYDMQYTDISYSIFLSLKSGFVGKKRLDIETYEINNKKYTVVFVPYALDDINRIENSIVLCERLIDLDNNFKSTKNYQKLYNNISSHLHDIDSVYTKFSVLKSGYVKMETGMKNMLSDHYKSMREYEIYSKNIVDGIWKRIEIELGVYKKEKKAQDHTNEILETINKYPKQSKVKHLKQIILCINKYGYYIESNDCDLNEDQYWSIYDVESKEQHGCIIKNKSSFEFKLDKPINISIYFDKDKTKFNSSLKTVEKILS